MQFLEQKSEGAIEQPRSAGAALRPLHLPTLAKRSPITAFTNDPARTRRYVLRDDIARQI
jgi:hypothetical protein